MGESEQAELKWKYDHRLETYKSMITISVEVFKYLVLLNGGAAAGMVATLDKLRLIMSVCSMRAAIGFFVAGLAFNGVAIICSYFTQNTLYGESVNRPGVGRHLTYLVCATISAALSLLAFCAGAITAVAGVSY
ncbi:hypothetical protein GTP38_11210 [Duganella sp. FT94W]|uniref:CASP-like protein n=1 Tax=Duganella lactea TaxID=2692173 RepID=A0ABW9VB95_9BURK|nr:hypothetical protein [Duganella lactea]MYM34907.1 hypothetical protein [Duganella lactea]